MADIENEGRINQVESARGQVCQILDSVSHINEAYGMSVENLLNLLARQMKAMSTAAEAIKDEEALEHMDNLIGESTTLIDLLKEKAGWNTFYQIGSALNTAKKYIG
ncbi:hypothetical protein [Sphingobacterium multivorum]|uniref:hypothetical protein n=1 Tax=Sphingobacterium multivorum TaxID=28454 RepID=UPI0028AFBC9F|nr:hypothetical protein [Sphingobacterium multivorum]